MMRNMAASSASFLACPSQGAPNISLHGRVPRWLVHNENGEGRVGGPQWEESSLTLTSAFTLGLTPKPPGCWMGSVSANALDSYNCLVTGLPGSAPSPWCLPVTGGIVTALWLCSSCVLMCSVTAHCLPERARLSAGHCWLCDLGQATSSLRVSVSTSVTWDCSEVQPDCAYKIFSSVPGML